MMLTTTFFFFFFFLFFLKLANSSDHGFVFSGFSRDSLSLDGAASITSSGLLELTNTSAPVKGHAFHQVPLHFKSTSNKALSFSTTFVFGILSEASDVTGHGIAFVLSRTNNLSAAIPMQFMGLFNQNNIGNSTNHIVAVELDTNRNLEYQDIDNNHVGIDINSLNSSMSHTAGYYEDATGSFRGLSLASGKSMQVWIDYDGDEMQLNVSLGPIRAPKPNRPLLSSKLNLTRLILDYAYVGFSSANGPFHTRHYILGWSFMKNGIVEPLDYSKLPSLPVIKIKSSSRTLVKCLPALSCSVVLLLIAGIVFAVRRRIKYAELFEDWELTYRAHRFSYKDLIRATKDFNEENLIGIGGFGRVYKGMLPNSKIEVAVKKVSHDSRQGLKEFLAEVCSIGQLRHRNLVHLLGYCRRKGELLLVYDFMPNGSLDKSLHDNTKPALDWAQRFRIIKGVASGLLYLHEDWEQVVIHRDIKASNVLLDSEFNGKLGDFGLARLYDHGADPQSTYVAGTMGYIAPELAVVGKATTATDVYAFGVFLLEVVCGRRPVVQCAGNEEELVLLDWVFASWQRGVLIHTVDVRLTEEYDAHEAELVLKLGLLCSHPVPPERPCMRQVMRILDGDAKFSDELMPSALSFSSLSRHRALGFDDYIVSFASVSDISGGR